MPTTEIDRIIAELEAIMETCIKTKNRAGYFAALYYKVTRAVKDGIVKVEFEDVERMEKLDVVFAQRYVDAWKAWQSKQPLPDSWRIAFTHAEKSFTLILQHLLLGINAHINLDLGVATIDVMNIGDKNSLRRDFVKINEILAIVYLDALKDIQRVSPLLSLLGLHARNDKSMLINFTIQAARDGAWTFAQDLMSREGKVRDDFFNARDKEIRGLGDNLVNNKGLLKLTALLVRIFEWNNPAKVIKVLKESHKTKLNG